jgi:hypothetical protein
MTEHFLFTPPRFTVRAVARVLGQMLGRDLPIEQTSSPDDIDAGIHVTDRVSVQVGADYLVVGLWLDEVTLRTWPPRRTLAEAVVDLRDALVQATGVAP